MHVKSRLVFVDLYTCFQKLLIIRLCQQEYHFFVRDTWCHDPDIYTAFCSEAQGGHHLIIYDQIWCADINIVFGAIDNIKINVLSYDLIVQGESQNGWT